MNAANNYSVGYMKCMVSTTPAELLMDGERTKEVRTLSRMEHQMESLGREFKLIEESHGKNTLSLTLVVGFLRKLLDNARVGRFLAEPPRDLGRVPEAG